MREVRVIPCLDVKDGRVVIGKAASVLAASIFHFGEISIPEAKRYLKEKGIPVKI